MSDNVIKVLVIIGLFIAVPVLLHFKRIVLRRRKLAGMNLPTEQEINASGAQDAAWAARNFLGKTREQITKEWADFGHCYYEHFYHMGPRAFCFYFPAAVDYVTTTPIADQIEKDTESDTASDLCKVVESRLKYDPSEIREAFPAILRFAEYLLTHYDAFGFGPEDDMRRRLEAIKRQCAESSAPPNVGAAT